MRISPIALIGSLLLLGACTVRAPVLGEPKITSSGSSVMTQTGTDADAPNEAMPKTTDSLEVAVSATGTTVRGSLDVDGIDINFGEVHCCELAANDPPLLIEYFDYDCAYCREYALTVRPWLVAEYVATGKIGVKRQFAPHTQWGRRMAQAAVCAARQSKFNELDAKLIAEAPATELALSSAAKRAGLATKPYDACMKQMNQVQLQQSMPGGLGIKRVPSFHIGMDSWEGVLDQETLQKRIEGSL